MPGSPNTAAAWKHLVRDQRRRAELTKFAVAVLDDLDAGDQVADRGGGLLPRAGTGWKVADETHGQFAFHTGTEIVGETYGGAAAIPTATNVRTSNTPRIDLFTGFSSSRKLL